MIDFVKRHPRLLVGFIAVEVVVLGIVGTTMMANAATDGQVLCNLVSGVNLDTAAGQRCDHQPYPAPGSSYKSAKVNTSTNQPTVYRSTDSANYNGSSNPATTHYTPEYPFDQNGNQIERWNTNSTSSTPASGSTNGGSSNSNQSTGTTSNSGTTTNGTVPVSPNHVYQYPFNAQGQQTGNSQQSTQTQTQAQPSTTTKK